MGNLQGRYLKFKPALFLEAEEKPWNTIEITLSDIFSAHPEHHFLANTKWIYLAKRILNNQQSGLECINPTCSCIACTKHFIPEAVLGWHPVVD